MKLNKRILQLLIISSLSITMIGCSNNSNSNETANNSSTSQEQIVEEEEIEEVEDYFILNDGMYKVGKDIDPGEYILLSNGVSSYYQVSSDSTGSLESIISNDNFTANRYITLADGQYIQIKNGCILDPEEKNIDLDSEEMLNSGMYKVGLDIEPGEYKVKALGNMGYVEVANDSKGILNSVASNDNFEGEKYVTVKDGQYLKLSNNTLLILE